MCSRPRPPRWELFAQLYRILIGKDRGLRLAEFIVAIGVRAPEPVRR